jgi:hypothetical protein
MTKLILAPLLVTACASPPPPHDDTPVNIDTIDTSPPDTFRPVRAPKQYRGALDFTAAEPDHDGASGGVVFTATARGGTDFCQWGRQLGDCCYSAAPDFGTSDPPQVSAGALTYTNLTSGFTSTTQFMADPTGVDYFVLWDLQPAIGDHIQISAAGDVVHAFTVDAVLPPVLTGMSRGFIKLDDFDPTAPGVNVSLSHDYDVTWTPAGVGVVDIQLSSNNVAVDCRADDAAGRVVIYKSILRSLFHAGDVTDAYANRLGVAAGNSDNADVTFNLQIGYGFAGTLTFVP